MKKTGRLVPTKFCRVIVRTGGSHQAVGVVWGEDVENGELPFTEDHVEFYQVDLDDAGVSAIDVQKIERLPPGLDLEDLTILRPLKEAAIKQQVLKVLEATLGVKLTYKG